METSLNGPRRVGIPWVSVHGLEMISADSDFARFTEIAWRNPVAR